MNMEEKDVEEMPSTLFAIVVFIFLCFLIFLGIPRITRSKFLPQIVAIIPIIFDYSLVPISRPFMGLSKIRLLLHGSRTV